MASSHDVLSGMKKEFGAQVISRGVEYVDEVRYPTGVFPADLAMGGGFPGGRISILFGPESSLKTTMALKAIAMCQKMHPELDCVFIDLENSYDPAWGAAMGVDNDSLIYVLPEFAEQVVDIAEGLLAADNLGIMVVDSLAAMTTRAEAERSADVSNVGGSSLVIGMLYRKVTRAQLLSRQEGRSPAFIAINQIRSKIGVMYGNPETMPGGNAFKFASSMTVRVYGKDTNDKAVDPVMPAWKECKAVIKKWKVPIIARNFEFNMSLSAGTGISVGGVKDWKTLNSYLQEFGLLTKSPNGKGWMLLDNHYKTLTEVQERLNNDSAYDQLIRKKVLEHVQSGEYYLPPSEEESEEEPDVEEPISE